MSNSDDSHEPLGYKNPPSWSKFKKGQSGNPKGRPSKRKAEEPSRNLHSELDEVLRSELDRTVTITERGKQQTLDMRSLVTRSQINLAAKGNVNAQRDVLKQIRELEDRDALRKVADEKARKEEEILDLAVYNQMADLKKQRQLEWDAAAAKGLEPEQLWPHPDDILLFPKLKKWDIRGPFDETDLPRFEHNRVLRDCLFIQSVLHEREEKHPSNAARHLKFFIWRSADALLPLRWQLADNFWERFHDLYRMRLNDLRKHLCELEERREYLRILAGIPDHDKEVDKTVNMIMKPLLKRAGFRSVAELNHTHAIHGDNIPIRKPIR